MNITSVMMVTFNRLEMTKRMMDNFLKTTLSPYRLIIVDNGSVDGTPEYLSSQLGHLHTVNQNCVGVDLHFNQQNKGIATGRNQCLKIADQYGYPYLATVDNDVELPVNWLGECLDIMDKNPNYTIGVNMEEVEYPLKTINGKTFQFKDKGNLGSACMVFDLELHRKIGFFYGYDALYATEDADWGIRSRFAGYFMGYLKENGVHFGTGDLENSAYREWKTACHAKNYAPFQQRCKDYMFKRLPVFVPYSEKQ
jgi:GT2 family glycosyltransferase